MRYSEGMDTTGVSDWHQDEVTTEQGPIQGSRVVFITEKPVRHHHLSMRRA